LRAAASSCVRLRSPPPPVRRLTLPPAQPHIHKSLIGKGDKARSAAALASERR